MKKISFLMAALLVAMVGCQKEPQAQTPETVDGKVYMSFSISTPQTKSATEDDGTSDAVPDTENGKDFENKISSIQVVLENSTTKATVSTTISTGIEMNTDKTVYTATFEDNALTAATYNVYVICNSSIDPWGKDGIQEISIVNQTGLNITTDNQFLMTNANAADQKEITSDDLKTSRNKLTPYDLGTIEVERTAARFDYKAKNTNNTYTLLENVVGVKLTEAAVINNSKGSYLYRRVTANGTDIVYGAKETKTNYVVDTDWTTKKELKKDSWTDEDKTKAATLFNNPLVAGLSSWDWLALSTSTDYNFLSYVAENTIHDVTNQINGISTGVVFKGLLVDNTGNTITADNANDYKFVFAGNYYPNWNKVVTAANTDSYLKVAVDKIPDNPSLNNYAAAGFTVFTPDTNNHYGVYYYYWNRHNNNGVDQMGPMEFAVVRNNVYKLMVESISQFGHPENPEGDPDPVDPTDPDEEVHQYFKVAVKVLPWTVRVNNIEF